MSKVSRMLNAIEQGDRQAAADLLPLVYGELRKLASVRMAAERPDHTLDATGLVHEAYLRLVGDQRFENRGHFFAAAAEAMRRILVDHARQHVADKRGGGRRRIVLDEGHRVTDSPEGLIALDAAIARFSKVDPKKAELVQLRFFTGLTMADAASMLNISLATAERWWAYARTWLFAAIEESEKSSDS